jgi:hypothetical protein
MIQINNDRGLSEQTINIKIIGIANTQIMNPDTA